VEAASRDGLREHMCGVALRGALPSYRFIHTEPVRNPSGALYEVRAYEREGGRLIGTVVIRPDGTLAPVRASQL
jgi:hypothetical protein